MPKESKNPLWNYFKISNENVSESVSILCKKNLSRGGKDPHKMTTKIFANASALAKFWVRHIANR